MFQPNVPISKISLYIIRDLEIILTYLYLMVLKILKDFKSTCNKSSIRRWIKTNEIDISDIAHNDINANIVVKLKLQLPIVESVRNTW